MYLKERPRIREGINNFCKRHNISVADMYVNYPSSISIKKQLKKMLWEKGQLSTADLRKMVKDREALK